MGPELLHNTYHVEVVRSQLTQNLGRLYPEIRDEVIIAFDEVLDLEDRGGRYISFGVRFYAEIVNPEWKNVYALRVIQNVVCRTSNRLFVGLPLCISFQLSVLILLNSE